MLSDSRGLSVSVVIPTHERPELLREALESAFAQTHPCLEVIVVDDGSSMDLLDVVAGFGGAARLLRQSGSRGANPARNAGVRAARGELIAFLDDDDIWLSDKIARQLAALEDREGCLCGQERSDNGQKVIQPISEVTEAMLRRGNHFCGMSGLLARRRALLEEPLDEELPSGQDWDIYIRLAKRQPLAYVPKALFVYRHSGHAGITLSSRAEAPETLAARAIVLEKHRTWFGEWRYRTGLARHLLKYASQGPQRLRRLVFALRRAGLLPTAYYVLSRILGFDKRVRPNRGAAHFRTRHLGASE